MLNVTESWATLSWRVPTLEELGQTPTVNKYTASVSTSDGGLKVSEGG